MLSFHQQSFVFSGIVTQSFCNSSIRLLSYIFKVIRLLPLKPKKKISDSSALFEFLSLNLDSQIKWIFVGATGCKNHLTSLLTLAVVVVLTQALLGLQLFQPLGWVFLSAQIRVTITLTHKQTNSWSMWTWLLSKLLRLLTRFLSHQVGAARAPLWGGRATWESETAEREKKKLRRFDCQIRLSSSAEPEDREEWKHRSNTREDKILKGSSGVFKPEALCSHLCAYLCFLVWK